MLHPQVGILGYGRSLPIELLHGGLPHALQILLHRRALFRLPDLARFPPRATLRLARASRTIVRAGFVHTLRQIMQDPHACKRQQFSVRATERIAFGHESSRTQRGFDAMLTLHARLPCLLALPRRHQHHFLPRHLLHVVAGSVATVGHHRYRLLAQILLHQIHPAQQLMQVVSGVGDRDSHNDLMRCFGHDLHVVARAPAPIAVLHFANFRLAFAGPLRLLAPARLTLPESVPVAPPADGHVAELPSRSVPRFHSGTASLVRRRPPAPAPNALPKSCAGAWIACPPPPGSWCRPASPHSDRSVRLDPTPPARG